MIHHFNTHRGSESTANLWKPRGRKPKKVRNIGVKKIANEFSFFLVTRIFSECSNCTKTLLDWNIIVTAIKHLTVFVYSEVRCSHCLTILKNSMDKIIKATAKSLIESYRSPHIFFSSVVLSEYSCVYKTTVEQLTYNIHDFSFGKSF